MANSVKTSLSLFIPLTKVDAPNRLVHGIATAELPDRSGEICDYATTKPYYQQWTNEMQRASKGQNLGNIRAMHGQSAAGKLVDISFNDEAKQIEICAKIVDDQEWQKVLEGVYTGFSQGGRYVKRWSDPNSPELTRYTAAPNEISLVDLPCLSHASFEVIKADGIIEHRLFRDPPAQLTTSNDDIVQVWQASDGSTFKKKLDALTHNQTLADRQLEKKSAEPLSPVESANAEPEQSNTIVKQLALACQAYNAVNQLLPLCDGEKADDTQQIDHAQQIEPDDFQLATGRFLAQLESRISTNAQQILANSQSSLNKEIGSLTNDLQTCLSNGPAGIAKLPFLKNRQPTPPPPAPSLVKGEDLKPWLDPISQRLEELGKQIEALQSEPVPHPLYRIANRSESILDSQELTTVFAAMSKEQRASALIKLSQTLPQAFGDRLSP